MLNRHVYPFSFLEVARVRTNSTKFLNFVMQNAEKQILPSESSAEEVSFEW